SMSLPASALLLALRQAGLLPPEQLKDAERLAAALPSADALAAALMGRGNLTEYQGDELSAGRGSGLVVGPYVLLDKLGEGGMGGGGAGGGGGPPPPPPTSSGAAAPPPSAPCPSAWVPPPRSRGSFAR